MPTFFLGAAHHVCDTLHRMSYDPQRNRNRMRKQKMGANFDFSKKTKRYTMRSGFSNKRHCHKIR
jgi:hypothetical protein